jgi:glycosyltransferase involved in cell wall biosynthesis
VTTHSPSISVVVPTYNRRERLHRVLTALAHQDFDEPFEVIVVSDGSTDGTDEYLANGEAPLPVRVASQPNRGPGAARNRGVELASGDLVVFVDDDVVATPSLLRMHVEAHRRLGPAVVIIGPMLTPPDHSMSPWIRWEQRMLEKQYAAMNAGEYDATPRQFYTGNASVRVEHVRRAGGFDATFRRAEDVELAYRLDAAGLTFHFEPTAVGYHYAERSFESWHGAARLYGRNDVVFARDRGQAWILPFIAEGFGRHHPLVRAAVRISLRAPWLARAAAAATRTMVTRRRAVGSTRPGQYALSIVYAMAYHGGVVDELGSAERFRTLVSTGRFGTS